MLMNPFEVVSKQDDHQKLLNGCHGQAYPLARVLRACCQTHGQASTLAHGTLYVLKSLLATPLATPLNEMARRKPT